MLELFSRLGLVGWWMDHFVFMFYVVVWYHDGNSILELFCMGWKINYGWNVWFVMAGM